MNILTDIKDDIFFITLNRSEKHNALNEDLIQEFTQALIRAEESEAKVIIIKSSGKNFSAGADLNWMKRVRKYTEDENFKDAMTLANLLYTLYSIKKPTISMINGSTYGGGIGIIAACDIAISTQNAKFCFSEVKLGLIPAVISPYIINAIGQRQANELFISAQVFDSQKAYTLGLIQHVVDDAELQSFTINYAKNITSYPPNTIKACKSLTKQVTNTIITKDTIELTASLIAKQRLSEEGKQGIDAFLKHNKFG